jgi:hypothetical protein
MKDNERICPQCDTLLSYSTKFKRERADKAKSVCIACRGFNRRGESHPMFGKPSSFRNKKHTEDSKKKISDNHIDVSGENNPMFGTNGGMFGKKHTEKSKEKISKGNKGKILSDESRERISKAKIKYYKNNVSSTKGRKHTEKTKAKMRLSRIKLISELKNEGVQIYPAYNRNSISILQNYALINDLSIIHAENGGEYFIKELGYWVDAYDIEKNIVIEYYEKYHKYNEDKDKVRRINIMNHLKCDFHIIKEDSEEIIIFKYKERKF